MKQAAATISSARQPRRRQVDQIVEARRRPAERAVARAAVADHAVGGVDGLVGGRRRQAADRQPEGRRDDAVGKILGEAFDRRARHAGLVEPLGIAPDDHRDGLAAFRQRRRFRAPSRPPRHARRGFAARAGCLPREPRRRCRTGSGQRAALDQDRPRRSPPTTMITRARMPASAAVRFAGAVAVQRAVEQGNQPADPDHRMADRADEPVRIAECQFGQQRQQGEGK